MGCFLLVLELVLPLQRLDKCLLCKVLGIGRVSHDTINLLKDAAEVVGINRFCRSNSSRPGSTASFILAQTAVSTS